MTPSPLLSILDTISRHSFTLLALAISVALALLLALGFAGAALAGALFLAFGAPSSTCSSRFLSVSRTTRCQDMAGGVAFIAHLTFTSLTTHCLNQRAGEMMATLIVTSQKKDEKKTTHLSWLQLQLTAEEFGPYAIDPGLHPPKKRKVM